MTEKKLLFISHITEEKELAIEFKKLVEKPFLGMLKVFVSSDENSISMGKKWLDNITTALNSCVVEIILCSPQSVQRPWINFEAGAGWIRCIPVIPLCHSGMELSELPTPLNALQGGKLSETDTLKQIFSVLAKELEMDVPSVDLADFIQMVAGFEKNHIATTAKIRQKNKITATKKLPIIGNRCELPSIPLGDFVNNTAQVFDSNNVVEDHNEIALEMVGDTPYLVFLDKEYDFTGKFAVVSYLI